MTDSSAVATDFDLVPVDGAEVAALRRHEVNDQLRRASRSIGVVAWFYRVGAVAYAVATMFAIVALARLDVPLRGGLQVVGLTTLLTVLLLAGAMHAPFRPFAWNLVLAGLATFVAFVHAVGPNPLGLALPASIALAALLWAMLVPTWRFRALIERHRDLYVLHHASAATRRSLKGRTPDERHERLLAAMHRAALRAWGASAGAACAIVLASAAGAYAVVAGARPQDLAEARGAFEAAWRASDVEAVAALFDDRHRDAEAAWLAGRVRGLGWEGALPTLAEPTRRDEAGSVLLDYVAGDVDVTARWNLVGTRWSLERIALPEPPFEPELRAFLHAWEASDPEALAVHFAADHRRTMRLLIEEASAGRAWGSFPDVRDVRRERQADGNEAADLLLEDGEVLTRWHLDGSGTWRLHYLRFPRR